MFRNMKISSKILLVVLAITLGTLLTISALSYVQMLSITTYSQNVNANLGLSSSDMSKQSLLDEAEEYLLKLADVQAESTNKTLLVISNSITELADYLDSLYQNEDNFSGRVLPLPDETEMGVASSKYMLAPGVTITDSLHDELLLVSNAEYAFAPILNNDSMFDNVYLGTESGISYRYSRSNAYNKEYDPRARGWYKAALAEPDHAVWLDTYVDSYGSVCISCAQAFHRADGSVAGVVAVDITLANVFQKITNVQIGESGFAFILDNNMEYIAHPRYGDTDFNLTPMTVLTGDALTPFEKIRDNDAGIVTMKLDDVDSYVTFATLGETKWKLCISIDIEEIISPANKAKDEIDTITDDAQVKIQQTLSRIILNYIIIFASIGILVIILAFVVSGSITRPIMQLAKTAKRFGNGELTVKAEVKGKDEVSELAQSFNTMTMDLSNYINELTTVTADKERIATELNVATEIQKSMLPCIFPAFPERKEFDIFASMDPAKEVGGDFYDFFMVDDRHLAIVVADVSGKGVPAALFMVIGKTLIKDYTQPGRDLGDIFSTVNNTLCESNSGGLFITAFEGVLDLVTGEFKYVNAGHEAPFICKKGGSFMLHQLNPGFVLAGIEDMKFTAGSVILDVGDKLFQYTDGVPEATASNDELYGLERLEAILQKNKDKLPDEILPAVKADVDIFVGDAPQFDDITMLCLEFKEKMSL